MDVRDATPDDYAAVAAIYNEGILGRNATFETRLRNPDDIGVWTSAGLPFVVAVEDGEVVAFALSTPYSPRECYRNVVHFSVYVRTACHGRGAGTAVMHGLMDRLRERGIYKMISGIFPENTASRALMAKLGFREVGCLEKQAQLGGVWRDDILVEKRLD